MICGPAVVAVSAKRRTQDAWGTARDASGRLQAAWVLDGATALGAQDPRSADEQVARFQNDPDVPVFVGQIATAGLGLTLTAASTMVFYSLDYSMSNFEQCKARIHRAGQRMPCTYIYLTAQGTVDEKVLKALKNKANLAKTLVDDYRYGNNPFM